MEKLHAVRAQIRAIGRSALVGTLVGLLSVQAFASGLNDAVKTADQPSSATAGVARAPESTPATNPSASLNLSSSSAADLPAAPEVAKAEAPIPLDPMVAAAAQDGQALTSAPKSSNKKLQRPGMLGMAIAGLPLMALGAYFYSLNTRNTSGKMEVGTLFFAPGAALTGLGFYFAFHKKN